ncbi:hypothetical protein [Haloarchaeobius sp. HRN-SO-5]|uniref:hypothetical protein n=1 Tax=Haloarchaeobius sp. HRN-SO-5 TaxID=3446118 RepID=UPI003EBB837C
MARSLGGTLVKGVVAVLALLFVLAVVGTVVSVVVGVLSAVVTLVVALGLLVLFGVAAAGVVSLLGDDDETDDAGPAADLGPPGADVDTEDPTTRLQRQYVAGNIDEREFERRLDLALDDPEAEPDPYADEGDRDELDRDLDRLWER